ncbi:hypothetical protein bthur0003_54220 [Bacillus thuringiensis serovar thuringiensis str. T01001]|nr:hypothetical protein bthur0003_54220 [Bacillus thuringiensis serovar thuringiensis str. T01001]EEM62187.1 hypothetical protein bthur0008_62370 [Bacillus thuringiensis serovar berliner ATCC 10792]
MAMKTNEPKKVMQECSAAEKGGDFMKQSVRKYYLFLV